MRLYCDGVFYLLHDEYLSHFKKVKKATTPIFVGIISDNDAEKYKRKPIYSAAKQR